MSKKTSAVYRPRFQMDFGQFEDKAVAKKSWDRFYSETPVKPRKSPKNPSPTS